LDQVTSIEADISISKYEKFGKNTSSERRQIHIYGILKIDPKIYDVVKFCIGGHIWSVSDLPVFDAS
jgi:hypothetical protein